MGDEGEAGTGARPEPDSSVASCISWRKRSSFAVSQSVSERCVHGKAGSGVARLTASCAFLRSSINTCRNRSPLRRTKAAKPVRDGGFVLLRVAAAVFSGAAGAAVSSAAAA